MILDLSRLTAYVPWLFWGAVALAAAIMLYIALSRRSVRRWIIYRQIFMSGFSTARSGGRLAGPMDAKIVAFLRQLVFKAESRLEESLRRRPFAKLRQEHRKLCGHYRRLWRDLVRQRKAEEDGFPPPRPGTIPTKWYVVGQTVVALGDIVFTSLGFEAFHIPTLLAWFMSVVFGLLLALLGDRVGANLKSPERLFEASAITVLGVLLNIAFIIARINYINVKFHGEGVLLQASTLAICSVILFAGSVILSLYHRDDVEYRLATIENAIDDIQTAHDSECEAYDGDARAYEWYVKSQYVTYQRGARRGWLGSETLTFPDLVIVIPKTPELPRFSRHEGEPESPHDEVA